MAFQISSQVSSDGRRAVFFWIEGNEALTLSRLRMIRWSSTGGWTSPRTVTTLPQGGFPRVVINKSATRAVATWSEMGSAQDIAVARIWSASTDTWTPVQPLGEVQGAAAVAMSGNGSVVWAAVPKFSSAVVWWRWVAGMGWSETTRSTRPDGSETDTDATYAGEVVTSWNGARVAGTWSTVNGAEDRLYVSSNLTGAWTTALASTSLGKHELLAPTTLDWASLVYEVADTETKRGYARLLTPSGLGAASPWSAVQPVGALPSLEWSATMSPDGTTGTLAWVDDRTWPRSSVLVRNWNGGAWGGVTTVPGLTGAYEVRTGSSTSGSRLAVAAAVLQITGPDTVYRRTKAAIRSYGTWGTARWLSGQVSRSYPYDPVVSGNGSTIILPWGRETGPVPNLMVSRWSSGGGYDGTVDLGKSPSWSVRTSSSGATTFVSWGKSVYSASSLRTMRSM